MKKHRVSITFTAETDATIDELADFLTSNGREQTFYARGEGKSQRRHIVIEQVVGIDNLEPRAKRSAKR